jgi:hypothetical protein
MHITGGSVCSRSYQPWNKGKLIGSKPPLQPKHVWAVRTRLQLLNRKRDWPSSISRSIASYGDAIS